MKKSIGAYLVVFLVTLSVFAQEEESAEVFLEEYTDEFQENFFEALKQKGIQNYDRAIELLLKCKDLDPLNSVLDYELAKAFAMDKQYVQAQEYAITALNSQPTDFWYLENLVDILSKQQTAFEVVQQRIPFEEIKLQENLAVIYFKKKNFEDALKVLGQLKSSEFANELTQKINDSLRQKNQNEVADKKALKEDDPIARFKSRIEALLNQSDYNQMVSVSKEALDLYPLQPYFYFAYGTALNRTNNSAKSVEVLESALDYLLDDDVLANKIYKELSKAYTTIGNSGKAQEYANKIKPGL